MDYYFFFQNEEYDSNWTKLLPTIISSSIVLVIYFLGLWTNQKSKLRENRSTWYLKVIIDPNFEKINLFFENVCGLIRPSVEELNKTKNTPDYFNTKVRVIGNFQNIKRDFEVNFLDLAKRHSPEISLELLNFITSIEDDITSFMDKDVFCEEEIGAIELKIKSYKSILFEILYIPLLFKKVKKNLVA